MSNKKSLIVRSQPSKIKLIIFDFDGVLADSFDSFYSLLRDSIANIGFSFTPDQYRELFIGNVHKSLKDLVGDEKKYLTFMEFRKNNYDKYYNVNLFSGAVETVKKLAENQILTIASSSKLDNVLNLLKKNKINRFFKLVLATSDHTKENMIQKILGKLDTEPNKAVMVTDTVGDIKVAQGSGLSTIAVSWGFHSANKLKKSKPDIIVKSFKELLSKIDKLS